MKKHRAACRSARSSAPAWPRNRRQLALDFQVERQPAKVLSLRRPEASAPGRITPGNAVRPTAERAPHDRATAEQFFAVGSSLDDGAAAKREEAAAAYRRALEIDPRLVPALINLANIHYTQDHLAEAMALYECAIGLEPDVFEGHFNLGNIHHDLGRYREAEEYYLHALAVNPRAVGPSPGYTSLIIRNDVGKMFLESAVKNKKLVFGPEADVAAIERLASLKVQRNKPGK